MIASLPYTLYKNWNAKLEEGRPGLVLTLISPIPGDPVSLIVLENPALAVRKRNELCQALGVYPLGMPTDEVWESVGVRRIKESDIPTDQLVLFAEEIGSARELNNPRSFKEHR